MPCQGVHRPAKANSGRSGDKANHTTSFFPAMACGDPSAFFSDFGLATSLYSLKLFAGTKHLDSGASHRRQCGELVLRMFVVMPGYCGGLGIPQRMIANSRCPSLVRTTGASQSG